MAYVSLRKWPLGGGQFRQPGDEVPEAMGWKDVRPWIDQRWIMLVPDTEIKDGRWIGYAEHAKSLGIHPPAPPPKSPSPAKGPLPSERAREAGGEDASSPPVQGLSARQRRKLKKSLGTNTKAELLDLLETAGLEAEPGWTKSNIIEALIDSEAAPGLIE